MFLRNYRMTSLSLTKEVDIVQSGILIDKKILIISDIHIGYEIKLQKLGLQIPYHSEERMIKQVTELIEEYKPEKVILNGDIKHEFALLEGKIKQTVIKFLEIISSKSELIIIKGNHDNSILGLLKHLHYEIQDYYIYKNYFFCHGDTYYPESEKEEIKTIIIGHQHPAIVLKNAGRKEKFKCLLYGYNSLRKKQILITPSFNNMTIGTNLINLQNNTPYIHENDLDDFHVYTTEGDKILHFQTLGLLREINHE